jgi:hypothetical protein
MPPATRQITFEELAQYFHLPVRQAASKLKICSTILKRVSRSYGMERWPYRKLKSLDDQLAKVKSIVPQTEAELTEKNEEIRRLCSRKLSMMKRPKLLNPSTIVMDGDITITTVGSPILMDTNGPSEDLVTFKAQSPAKLTPNSPLKMNFNILPTPSPSVNPTTLNSLNTSLSLLNGPNTLSSTGAAIHIPTPDYKPILNILNFNDTDLLSTNNKSSSCINSNNGQYSLTNHHPLQHIQSQQMNVHGLLTVSELMHHNQAKRNPLEPTFNPPLSRYEEIVAWKQRFIGERENVSSILSSYCFK